MKDIFFLIIHNYKQGCDEKAHYSFSHVSSCAKNSQCRYLEQNSWSERNVHFKFFIGRAFPHQKCNTDLNFLLTSGQKHLSLFVFLQIIVPIRGGKKSTFKNFLFLFGRKSILKRSVHTINDSSYLKISFMCGKKKDWVAFIKLL